MSLCGGHGIVNKFEAPRSTACDFQEWRKAPDLWSSAANASFPVANLDNRTFQQSAWQENFRPRLLRGLPRIIRGLPRFIRGRPHLACGRPRIARGCPRIARGSPRLVRGFPRVPRGFPRVRRGFPRASRGYPRSQRGRPRFVRGRPRRTGCDRKTNESPFSDCKSPVFAEKPPIPASLPAIGSFCFALGTSKGAGSAPFQCNADPNQCKNVSLRRKFTRETGCEPLPYSTGGLRLNIRLRASWPNSLPPQWGGDE